MLEFLVGNNALSTLVAFGLVLIPAILIHELGHFLAARAVGITILEFGIGFPPKALTLLKRGETEYTLNWLPFGGFVRPLGETFVRPHGPDEADEERVHLQQDDAATGSGARPLMAVNEARPLARIIFMSAGSAANLLTAMVLFVLIGLAGIPTILGGSAGIIAADAGAGLAPAGLRPNDRITQIDGQHFGSVSDFLALLRAGAGEQVTLEFQRAGDRQEVTLRVPELTVGNDVYVAAVAPDSPAAAAGIVPGDLIVAFNSQSFADFTDLQALTRAHLGQTVTLTLLRDGTQTELSLVPRRDPPAGEGAIGIGIVPAWRAGGLVLVEGGRQQGLMPLSLPDALRFGLDQLALFVETLLSLPGRLVAGSLQPEEARLMSPLAISQVGGRFLQDSIEQEQPYLILTFIALISTALGLTNLLPLPALDGGRILFVLVELVRGQPVAPEREGMVHLFGMALLLSLMVITVVNDVVNPITSFLP